MDVRQRKINGNYINDYSKGKRSIIDDMKPYTIAYTQKEAGFKVETNEKILYVFCNKKSTFLLFIQLLCKSRWIKAH